MFASRINHAESWKFRYKNLKNLKKSKKIFPNSEILSKRQGRLASLKVKTLNTNNEFLTQPRSHYVINFASSYSYAIPSALFSHNFLSIGWKNSYNDGGGEIV